MKCNIRDIFFEGIIHGAKVKLSIFIEQKLRMSEKCSNIRFFKRKKSRKGKIYRLQMIVHLPTHAKAE